MDEYQSHWVIIKYVPSFVYLFTIYTHTQITCNIILQFYLDCQLYKIHYNITVVTGKVILLGVANNKNKKKSRTKSVKHIPYIHKVLSKKLIKIADFFFLVIIPQKMTKNGLYLKTLSY